MLGLKKILGQKIILSPKEIGCAKKNCVQTNDFGSKKKLRVQKNWSPKKIWVQRNFWLRRKFRVSREALKKINEEHKLKALDIALKAF